MNFAIIPRRSDSMKIEFVLKIIRKKETPAVVLRSERSRNTKVYFIKNLIYNKVGQTPPAFAPRLIFSTPRTRPLSSRRVCLLTFLIISISAGIEKITTASSQTTSPALYIVLINGDDNYTMVMG